MNYLLDLTGAGDKAAIAQTNFQRLAGSLAFAMSPSLDQDGNPTALFGPPTAGTFLTGQFWVDAALAVWRCTEGGEPGTWIQQAAAVVAASPVGALPNNYLITRPDLNWAQFYWDGANWQAVFLQP